jgi:hypothetical protein
VCLCSFRYGVDIILDLCRLKRRRLDPLLALQIKTYMYSIEHLRKEEIYRIRDALQREENHWFDKAQEGYGPQAGTFRAETSLILFRVNSAIERTENR